MSRTQPMGAAGNPAADARLWAVVRLLLGFAQMSGTALTVGFLAALGVDHPWSLAAALGTTALTFVSHVLFPRR